MRLYLTLLITSFSNGELSLFRNVNDLSNYDTTKLSPLEDFEANFLKSKVSVLGDVLKKRVADLRKVHSHLGEDFQG